MGVWGEGVDHLDVWVFGRRCRSPCGMGVWGAGVDHLAVWVFGAKV